MSDESNESASIDTSGSITSDSESSEHEGSSKSEPEDLFSGNESGITETSSDSDSQELEASSKLVQSTSSSEKEPTEEVSEGEKTRQEVGKKFSVHRKTLRVTSRTTRTVCGITTRATVDHDRITNKYYPHEEIVKDEASEENKNETFALVPQLPTEVLEATNNAANIEETDGAACGDEDAGTEQISTCNESAQPLTEAMEELSLSNSPDSRYEATPRQFRLGVTNLQRALESPYYTRQKARLIREQGGQSRSQD